MIESMTLENFLSFRDRTVFDFTATAEKPKKDYEYLSWYQVSNKKKLLKTIFLFGNNGSGKSNFLSALSILRMFVLKRKESKSSHEELPFMQFRFESKCLQSPSLISVVIHIEKVRYTYTIVWDTKVIRSEVLMKQTGRKADELVFRRTFDPARDVVEIEFAPKCKISEESQRLIRQNVIRNTTVISLYDTKNFEALDIAAIYHYFESPQHYTGLNDERLDLCTLLTKRDNAEQLHDLLTTMLKCVGSNIADFKVDTTKRKLNPQFTEFLRERMSPEDFEERFPEGSEVVQYLRFAHYNNDGLNDPKAPYIWLTEGEESTGTLNMIRLMIILIDAARKNSLVCIDECAMGIHQETFNRIIQLYLTISSGSQVFLATQALPVLDMDGFRRDTARFFDKDFLTGVSSVECVDLRKFHANKNLYKNYVDHAFGGKPMFPDDEDWKLMLQEFRNELNGEKEEK